MNKYLLLPQVRHLYLVDKVQSRSFSLHLPIDLDFIGGFGTGLGLGLENINFFCESFKVSGVIKAAPSRRLVSTKGVLGSEGRRRIASEITDYISSF